MGELHRRVSISMQYPTLKLYPTHKSQALALALALDLRLE